MTMRVLLALAIVLWVVVVSARLDQHESRLEVHQSGRLGSYFDSREATDAHFFRLALQLVTQYLTRDAA